MFTKAVLTSILATLAAAAPSNKQHAPAENAYTAIAIHSGDQAVHQHSINANYGFFYLNRNTSTECIQGPCYAYGNGTYFVPIPSASAAQALKLDVSNPTGEQHVYVTASGSLAYTAPGETVPTDGQVGDFVIDSQTGKFTFQEQDFWACPASGGVDLVLFAAAATHGTFTDSCTQIGAQAYSYDGPPAYEYQTSA